MNYVYIIQSTKTGKFYTEYIKNLQQRILQHQEDRGGWAKGKGPWVLKYYETFELNSEARKREIQLKKKKAHKRPRSLRNSKSKSKSQQS